MKIRCQWFAHIVNIIEICEVICLVQSKILPDTGPEDAGIGRASRLTEWDDPLKYLTQVISMLSERVTQFGIENLPLPDKLYNLNDTRYNIHLFGPAKYSNGFLVSIHGMGLYSRDYIWYFDNSNAVIQFKVVIGLVDVFYDLDADLDVEHLSGTADLDYPENIFQVEVTCKRDTLVRNVTQMRTSSVSGPSTKFSPDSDVMRALAYNARLTMSSSMFSDLDLWIEYPMKGFMVDIVQEVPFPLK